MIQRVIRAVLCTLVLVGCAKRAPTDPTKMDAQPVHLSVAKLKNRLHVEYPGKEAKKLGIDYDVDCNTKVFVDEEGHPFDVQFEDCPEIFREPAKKAFMKSLWHPHMLEGKAVPFSVSYEIHFKATMNR